MKSAYLAAVLAALLVVPVGRVFADPAPAKEKYVIHGITYDVLTRKAACSVVSKDKPMVTVTVSFTAKLSPDTPERDIKRALAEQLRSILTDAAAFEAQP